MRNLCAWPKDVSCLRLCSSKCLIKQMCCYSKIIVFSKGACAAPNLVIQELVQCFVPAHWLFQRMDLRFPFVTLQSFEQVEFIPHQNQKCLCGSFVLGLLYATCSYFAPFYKWLSLFKMIVRNPFIVSANNAHNHCVTWTECLLRQSTSFWFLLGFDEYHFQILSFPKIFHEKSIPILDRE